MVSVREEALAELGRFVFGKGDAPIVFEAAGLDGDDAVGVAGDFEVFGVLGIHLGLLRVMVGGAGGVGSDDFHNVL